MLYWGKISWGTKFECLWLYVVNKEIKSQQKMLWPQPQNRILWKHVWTFWMYLYLLAWVNMVRKVDKIDIRKNIREQKLIAKYLQIKLCNKNHNDKIHKIHSKS